MPTRVRPKVPTPPTPPTPEPPKPVPPTTTPITGTTPFRDVGTISVDRLCEILKHYPLGPSCREIHAAIGGRALPVAMSWMESNYGQSTNARAHNNPLGLFTNGAFRTFVTNAAAFAEWVRRMDDPSYGGGVYQPKNKSLHDMVITYVCGPNCKPGDTRCGVDGSETYAECEAYLNATVDRLNRYFGRENSPAPTPPPSPDDYVDWDVAGSTVPLRLPRGLPFKQQLTPFGILNRAVGRPNRSGLKLSPWTGTTQHSTGNSAATANAQMHANWQNTGTPGHPDGVIAVHFYGDDTQVIQCLPIDERGIHAGEPRNTTNVAYELCVNSGRNVAKAEANAVAAQAGLLRILGKTGTEAMSPHTFNASGHCPRLSMAWSAWEDAVDAQIRAIGGTA
jgi:hypothetical protein